MALQAAIRAIEYYLPEKVLSTADLAAEYPEWSVEKIQTKTGICERRIAAADECASDLAVGAAKKLFASGACAPADIDYLLLCTQSPDYFLPTTACVLQDRLGIPTTAGALDFNLGCSGFVYGLGLAQGLIASGQASNVLLITSETYSKFIHPGDRSVRTLFGDGAAATLIQAVEASGDPFIGPFVFGTDGRGAQNLIVETGGMRHPRSAETAVVKHTSKVKSRSRDNLFMDGAKILSFTLRAVPLSVKRLLRKTGKALDDVDLFVFHQANQFMLEHLRRKLGIPCDRFVVALSHCGNTVSSTIPIALKSALETGRLTSGSLVMLVGFGVGYSWGATFVRWL
jgi:3-oxoacyl-[acyl-carrier-protein] synthase-3